MKKPLFNSIAIIGVGLIGGSLGLAIKKKKLAKFVIGVTRRKETIYAAFEKKAIDVATLNAADGVSNTDLVILCAPVSTIVSQIKEIAPYLKKGAVVMDVGSSKLVIETQAKRFLKKNKFVGCHPMAGSECRGVEHAGADLFEKSVCFVTQKDPHVFQFWKAVGATPVFMPAQAHDAWAAKASHLPHLLAFSLFQDFKVPVAGLPLNPSLQGLGRIAKSDPGLWADILLSNDKNVVAAIRAIQKNLFFFQKALRSKNRAALIRLIRNANKNTP